MFDGLRVGGTLCGLLSGQTQVFDRLSGIAPFGVVVREFAIVVFEVVAAQDFHSLGRFLMQRLALFVQHCPIRYFLGQRMFEDIFDLRERRLLIEELPRLQRR
jgi:hypothetical protein